MSVTKYLKILEGNKELLRLAKDRIASEGHINKTIN